MTIPSRGSREAGKATRQALLCAATEVFRELGETASVAQICRNANTYPNQVTYYFGSKEHLFVEVACAAVLRGGRHAEEAASAATTVGEYTHALIFTLIGDQARNVELFTTAMSMASRRPELRPQIAETLSDLHRRGAEALMRTLVRTGWELRAPIDVEARAFWSAIFGLVIQQAAASDELDYSLEEAVAIVFTNLQIPEQVLQHAI
ncbi:TetR/AcrR family transcriptional regulator C-terminal domain-containing protein [Gordonia sp. ABSL11-1]|uniref:TetR/AcrR family transcriptional regulator C-terminal domain-containing protein n=1 Tax=Gordonia sp. ABSL11-1 TaxID=3053924 RepID=UPI002572C9D3|nr:TetR/AcrR family transcriptional regulator C-terminal domain-containing protein [Gordonia sp. ABSL11-1]MDL9946494.1 TetR/AcrR family transcriptional regulator C-terminal domain-containing protein [Gordonia sp. ABSL11-1]